MKRTGHTIEAIKNFRQIGGVVASSRILCRKLMNGIDFNKDLNILELGAGNGNITNEILKRMSPGSTLHSYEIHPPFAKALQKIKDNRLVIKDECVSNIVNYEQESFDIVISSLPLAILSKKFKSRIYDDIKSRLKSPGMFIQYQYSLFDYKDLEKNFRQCKIEFCLFNIPPAFIYKIKYENESDQSELQSFKVA